MEDTQKVFAALADPARRKVIEILHQGDSTLLEMAERFPFSFQALSKHIHILEAAGLVDKVRNGKFRVLSLRHRALSPVLKWITYYSDFWNDSFDQLDDLIRAKDIHGDED